MGFRGTANGNKVTFGGEEILQNYIVEMVEQPCEYIKNHLIIDFKMRTFVVCELSVKSLMLVHCKDVEK